MKLTSRFDNIFCAVRAGNEAKQLGLVVYSKIFRVLWIPGGAGAGFLP